MNPINYLVDKHFLRSATGDILFYPYGRLVGGFIVPTERESDLCRWMRRYVSANVSAAVLLLAVVVPLEYAAVSPVIRGSVQLAWFVIVLVYVAVWRSRLSRTTAGLSRTAPRFWVPGIARRIAASVDRTELRRRAFLAGGTALFGTAICIVGIFQDLASWPLLLLFLVVLVSTSYYLWVRYLMSIGVAAHSKRSFPNSTVPADAAKGPPRG